MTSRPLSDDEVHQEMKKMVAFIKQEAIEKAREIQVKADEEFNIEKAKLVRQETMNIEEAYAKRMKQVEVKKKIAQSTIINKARLRVLEAREGLLHELFDSTREKLGALSSNATTYAQVMKGLVLQCLYQLMEEEVVVRCRKQDETMLQGVLEQAKTEYTQATKKSVKVTIESSNPLPSTGAGGVIMSGLFGRIMCNNTLEQRLELLSDMMLPDIRILLFGVSETRSFYD